MTVSRSLLAFVGPSCALALVRLFGPVRPLSAFMVALCGQLAFIAVYVFWEFQQVRWMRRAIEDPNTQVTITYTQASTTSETRSIAGRIVARLWTLPGLFVIACALAVIFLGLQRLVS